MTMNNHDRNQCRGCVFHLRKCLVGIRRPWNQTRCENFLPYCLICTYPESFCTTCCNRLLRTGKPVVGDMRMTMNVASGPPCRCEWRSKSK